MKPDRKTNPLTLAGTRKPRSWFFLLMFAFPAILFMLLEGVFTALRIGPDVSLFRIEEISGRQYYNMNPGVKSRYFSRVKFDPMTSMDFFPVVKSEGTFRIFCLGASTTAGYPYGYAGSFSTFLRSRLKAIFPHRSLEIVNLGLTATNSYTVLDFAEEVVDLEPDLLLVYDGHNEFYGALGASSNETVGGLRWLTRLYLNLVHLKTFLMMRDAYESLLSVFHESDGTSRSGTMMERLAKGQHVPYKSDVYEETLSAFSENVEELLLLCRERNIPLILSSQVSNLRHQPPFVAEGSQAMSEEDREKFDEILRKGQLQLEQGYADSAAGSFHRALLMDSLRADVHFGLARSFDALGEFPSALAEYRRARDLDQLRFRMSTDFNEKLRDLCAKGGALFADIEDVLSKASSDSIVGREILLEHLHPTSRGYFLIAKEYARIMKEHELAASATEWSVGDTLSDEAHWNNRVLTTLDDRAAQRRTELLVSSWPFVSMDRPLQPVPNSDRIGLLVDRLLGGTLSWEAAHVAAAEYYEGSGEFALAEREYQLLVDMIPINASPYLRLGRLYLKQLKYEEGYAVLKQSLTIEPTVYASRALGAIAVDTGNPAEAIPFLETAVRLGGTRAEEAQSLYLLALACGRAGLTERARNEVVKAVAADPSHKEARDLMTRLNNLP